MQEALIPGYLSSEKIKGIPSTFLKLDCHLSFTSNFIAEFHNVHQFHQIEKSKKIFVTTFAIIVEGGISLYLMRKIHLFLNESKDIKQMNRNYSYKQNKNKQNSKSHPNSIKLIKSEFAPKKMNRTQLADQSTYFDTDSKRTILQPIELQLASNHDKYHKQDLDISFDKNEITILTDFGINLYTYSNIIFNNKTEGGVSFQLSSRSLSQKNWEKDIKEKKFSLIEEENLSEEKVKRENVPNGLISLFNSQNIEINIKPKVIVCVTMYNEARKELEETLDGIVSNISTFKNECNISNNEIMVIVVYDGIDRMNASKDSDDSMLEYFSTWDQIAKTNQRRTMRQEYDEYCYNVKLSKIDVEKIKSNDFKELHSEQRLDTEFKKQSLQNKEDQRSIEQQKSEFLYNQKKKASDYIQSKVNNAYLYQMKHILQQASSGEEQDSSNIFESQETLNILHCVKYQNGGKLSSHLWFFCGFCELMQPDYTILLDCGLVPDSRAIFNMFLALETDKNIGGVCGFMGIKFQDIYTEGGERNDNYKEDDINCLADIFQRVFDIQKAQQYEYNMGHFIDKPFESLFGYIQVLPGAFSGYRWEALKRDEDQESILDDYLSSVLDKDQELTLEQENMNLAEDRILCLKIFSKRGKKYTLRYLPNCRARVDPVTNLMVLVSQRRRWINGSTFALRMCLENKSIIYESNHSPFQIVLFKISMMFAWLNDALSYVSLSVYFTIVFIMVMTNFSKVTLDGAINTGSSIQVFFTTLFLASYFLVILMIIFYSLSFDTRNKHMHQMFYSLSCYLGIMMIAAYIFMMIYVVQITIFTIQAYILGNKSGWGTDGILESWDEGFLKETFCFMVVIGFFVNFVPYIFNYTRICEMVKTFLHFVAYQSQYIHLLLIYAFCRIDDLSWGTKGSDVSSSQKEVSKKIKFSFVTKWFLLNVGIGFMFGIFLTSQILDSEDQYKYVKPMILVGISFFFVGQLSLRVVGAVLYELYFWFFMIKMSNKRSSIAKERKEDKNNQTITTRAENFFHDKAKPNDFLKNNALQNENNQNIITKEMQQ